MNRSKQGGNSNSSLNLSGVLDVSGGARFLNKRASLGISPIKKEPRKFIPSTLLINLAGKFDDK